MEYQSYERTGMKEPLQEGVNELESLCVEHIKDEGFRREEARYEGVEADYKWKEELL
jgi:hypothetical protein